LHKFGEILFPRKINVIDMVDESKSDPPPLDGAFIAWTLVVLIELVSAVAIFLIIDASDFYILLGVLIFIIVCFIFSIRIRPSVGLTRHR
jgi:hypothetical protein